MTTMDRVRKVAAINQLLASGKWKAVDALGREVSAKEAGEVTHVACAHCGKSYKWNQTSWLAKHELEHAAEMGKLVPAEDVVDNSNLLIEMRDQLWTMLERVENAITDQHRKARQSR